ncbi:MAG: MATE family efflux transporter [Treponema sp.]|jgi:putative MATE family efflux protein|nr:MATE family efflux transporter [Treponema sp.]
MSLPAENRRFSTQDLIHLLIPLIIDQTLSSSLGMFDTIMVSGAGEGIVAGVSLVNTINILLNYLFTALATGGAIIAAQYLGRGDKENSCNAARHLVIASIFFSALVMTFCLVLNRPLLSLLFGNISPEVMRSARSYFYITALACPFTMLFNSGAALFRGMGDSKTPMINAAMMNVVNIAGNAVFIYGLGWGAFGAGLATTLSRVASAVVIMRQLRNPKRFICVRTYHFKNIDQDMMRRILKIAVPNGLENSLFQAGKIMLTSLVAAFGTTAIAANAVGQSIATVAVIPSFSIGLAATTIVAQCTGAGEYDEADFYIKRLLKCSYIFMVVLNSIILLALNPIMSVYKLSPETFRLARQIAMIHGVAAVALSPVSFALPNAFRAAGDVKFPMWVSILSMLIFRIGSGYVFAYIFGLGALSVWVAMVLDWVVRGFCFIWRWRSGKWKDKKII